MQREQLPRHKAATYVMPRWQSVYAWINKAACTSLKWPIAVHGSLQQWLGIQIFDLRREPGGDARREGLLTHQKKERPMLDPEHRPSRRTASAQYR